MSFIVPQDTQVASLGWEGALEQRMASHSIILAWKISWTKEPAGYSLGVAELDTTEGLTYSLSV